MDRTALLSRRGRATGLVAAAALTLSLLPAGVAVAATSATGCEARANITYDKLLECVTVDGVLEHEKAFQAIADANGGNRAAGLPGYEASVDYVVDTLEAAGWDVSIDEFPFTYVGAARSSSRSTPVAATYVRATPPRAPGTATSPRAVTPVDIAARRRATRSTSGCEAADFAG